MSGCGTGGYQGGYTGGCWGGLYRGTTQPAARARKPHTQRSGPRNPCKGWSGWGMGLGACTWGRRRGRSLYHPFGARSVPAAPPCTGTSQIAALQPIRARFQVIFLTVSQNREVSPEYPEKASHSPYLQNGLRKSPLDISRITFPPAFSHKELMAYF